MTNLEIFSYDEQTNYLKEDILANALSKRNLSSHRLIVEEKFIYRPLLEILHLEMNVRNLLQQTCHDDNKVLLLSHDGMLKWHLFNEDMVLLKSKLGKETVGVVYADRNCSPGRIHVGRTMLINLTYK